MGGGGANSLDSPKTGENSDFTSDKNDTGLSEDNSKEEDTITEYTYKTYDDYFTDYNITAETITENDLTGKGSATDPYVVYSTRGFLYLTNYTLSKINLDYKYVELYCDIILNDETFDENGVPSGGDGNVYSWQKRMGSGNYLNFNGNCFSVKGMYLNDDTASYVSLFAHIVINKIENVNVENIFINAHDRVYGVCYDAYYLSNIEVSGTLIAKYAYSAGITNSVYKEIKNCKNFVNISANYYCAGIAYDCRGIARNLENYGNISANTSRCAGIFVILVLRSNLSNCFNFGDITAGKIQCGGIVGALSGDNVFVKMENCINYGKLTLELEEFDSGAANAIGGLIAQGEGVVIFNNCKNEGDIVCEPPTGAVTMIGQFIGYALSYYTNNNAEIIVKNCDLHFYSQEALVGNMMGINNERVVQLTIKNCIITYEDYLDEKSNIFINAIHGKKVDINVENVELNVQGDMTRKVYLFSGISSTSEIKIVNLLVNTDMVVGYYPSNVLISLKSVVVSSITRESLFYGSDFSDFFINWKTGKIGLKALSSKGFYQASLTEDILINKGYEKKEV